MLKINIIIMKGEALSCLAVVSKENNMLKLGTESSRLPKGLQIDSLFCSNNAILKYMCKLKFLLTSTRIKRGVFFSAVILARHAKS